MAVNRKKLALLLCALAATAVAAGTAAASHQGTPGVTSKQVTIGGTFPLTGPASLYAAIPAAEAAYYAYVNAKGGVHGRTIKDIVLDDQYDPGKTPGLVKQLVEQKHVFAVVGSLGTAPGLATWGYLNKNKVPQVLLATGDAYWGTCFRKVAGVCGGSTKPWTMGWQPDYPGEAKLYAHYMLSKRPNARIGVLYQNDAYGKNYLNGLKAGLGAKKGEIVDAESYDYTDSSQQVAAHVASIAAHQTNVFVIFATPAASIAALATKTQIPGWNPLTFLNNVSANRLFLLSAGANTPNPAGLNGVISTSYVASQTTQPTLPGVKLAKRIISKYAPTLKKDFATGDLNIMYGLGSAWTFVHALQNAGKKPTRESLMAALRSMNTSKNPFIYPGFTIKTSHKRGFPMEQLIFSKWAGGASGDWKIFGKVHGGVK